MFTFFLLPVYWYVIQFPSVQTEYFKYLRTCGCKIVYFLKPDSWHTCMYPDMDKNPITGLV